MPEQAKARLREAIKHLNVRNSIVDHKGGVAIVSLSGTLHEDDFAAFAAAARKAALGLRVSVSTDWMVRGAGSEGPLRRELIVAHFQEHKPIYVERLRRK